MEHNNATIIKYVPLHYIELLQYRIL